VWFECFCSVGMFVKAGTIGNLPRPSSATAYLFHQHPSTSTAPLTANRKLKTQDPKLENPPFLPQRHMLIQSNHSHHKRLALQLPIPKTHAPPTTIPNRQKPTTNISSPSVTSLYTFLSSQDRTSCISHGPRTLSFDQS